MKIKTITLRLEETLYLKLRAIAKKEYRSLNKQIAVIIRSYLEEYEATK